MLAQLRVALCEGLMGLTGLGAAGCGPGESEASSGTAASVVAVELGPRSMAVVGRVDERYQSYNVEMLEVTGGKFWRPYGPVLDSLLRQPIDVAASTGNGDTPAGMNPTLYEYRSPLDLKNPRLRELAAALGPAYMRVSGTWANTTYLAESDVVPPRPPSGFMGVLSRQQWKGVIDFAKAVDALMVTSFATGSGTRDAHGGWTPTQARRWVEYTRSIGGTIAAAEFMNEPNLAAMGGAPTHYDPAAYGRDFKIFRAFADAVIPDMIVLGPGAVGETSGDWDLSYGATQILKTRDMLAASRPAPVDAFSYHHYGATSQRCQTLGAQTAAADALSEAWLRRTDETLAFYKPLRDEFAPGTRFWLTETADAACGGNPWAGTFLDTFRYLDQLGRLAKQDVEVVMHNTLVASDYGMLDDKTFAPKPNYWGAVLWRKLMGTTVLDAGVPIQAGLHVYAHCLRGTPGGVALLAINNDPVTARTLSLPTAAERYTLSAESRDLQTASVQLNGKALALGAGSVMPGMTGVVTTPGDVSLAPATITFLALGEAGNSACR